MLVRTILLLAFAAVLMLFGLADTCPVPIIEVRSWDGYKLQFRPSASEEWMTTTLREHDAIADQVVLIDSPKYLPPSLRPSVKERIADARAKLAASSWWACRLLW